MDKRNQDQKYSGDTSRGSGHYEPKSSFFRKSLAGKKAEYSKEEEEQISKYLNVAGHDEKVSSKSASFLKKNKFKRRPRHVVRNIFLLIFTVIAMLVGSYFWRLEKALGVKSTDQSKFFAGKTAGNGANNILLMGTDQRKGEGSGAARADSIMILQLDGADSKPRIISLLRDVLVDIPNVGTPGYTDCKLNAAYGIGELGTEGANNQHQGVELMRQTVRNNFGIDCKYYALADFSSFSKAVDMLFPEGLMVDANFATVEGNIVGEVEVPDDLNAKSDGFIPLQKIKVGKQTMDGRTLLNYARFRHDDENDFGRVKRQQQALSALTVSAKENFFQTILQVPETIGAVLKVTSTNIERKYFRKILFFLANGKILNYSKLTVPAVEDNGKYEIAYDLYGGQGIDVDLKYYRKKIANFLG